MVYDYTKLKPERLLQLVQDHARIIDILASRWEAMYELVESGKEITEEDIAQIENQFPMIIGGK